ncbi:MAG: hypothetical protein HY461_02930 [Parcubacteria group bacterium]|nr:hypothetical protein [Parcubacteria group bacterium]
MFKKYFAVAVFVSVFAVGFIAPQFGRAQTADDAYIQSLRQLVVELTKQVQVLLQRLNAVIISGNQPQPASGYALGAPSAVVTTSSIQLTGPAEGALWGNYTSKTITWTSSGLPASTTIGIILQDSTFQRNDIALFNNLPNTGSVNWFVSSSYPGPYVLRVIARWGPGEGDGTYSQHNFSIVTTENDRAPIISNVSGPNTLVPGQVGTWTITASDPDGDALKYYMCYWNCFFSSNGVFQTSFAGAETIGLRFFAVDTKGASDAEYSQITITPTINQPPPCVGCIPIPPPPPVSNQPPTATISGTSTVPVGISMPWFFRAADPEGFNLSYVVNWGDGTGQSTGTTGSSSTFVLSHTYTRAGTTSTIAFTATDIGGLAATSFFPVVVIGTPPPPLPPPPKTQPLIDASIYNLLQGRLDVIRNQLLLLFQQIQSF